jgi:hypothetical protein
VDQRPVVFNLFPVPFLKGEGSSADSLDIFFVDDHEFFRDAASFLRDIEGPQITNRVLEL